MVGLARSPEDWCWMVLGVHELSRTRYGNECRVDMSKKTRRTKSPELKSFSFVQQNICLTGSLASFAEQTTLKGWIKKGEKLNIYRILYKTKVKDEDKSYKELMLRSAQH